ncbi:hypothetical protein DBV05_g12472, partial [Lasiodiplodia theobromae]
MPEEESPELAEEMRLAVQKYMASAKLAQSRIPLLTAPSLTLLQALLCSAFMMQGQGDTAACWTFTSAACKTCMDLGLHTNRGDFWDPRAEINELYYCFAWCYILDRSFAMNLGRQTSVLDTNLIRSTESVWDEAPVNLLTVYLELARIQSVVVLELSHKTKGDDSPEHLNKSLLIVKLIEQMQYAKKEMDRLKEEPEKFRGLFMESEMNALEFSYWSVMTAIRRCERAATGSKTSVGDNCLEAARSAISSLRSLQKPQLASEEGGIGLGTTMSFVNWTLLFYPLTPFFVLFCNVVATSNRDDFALMKAMTEELSELADRSTSIDRLQRLFTVFLGLAEPLLDEDVDADGEDDDDGNAATTTNGTGKQDSNNKTRRGRRRHRRKHSSYGQALDMYFKLKGSSTKPGSATTALPSTSRPTTRNHPNPTSDPAPPPPWDTGPYTSTFHLSDIVPTTTAPTAATANATAPPSPSSTFPPLRTSSAPTLPAAAAAAAAAAATAAASNMYVSSPAPSHVSHNTSIGTTVAGGAGGPGGGPGGGAAGGPGGNYAMQYSLPPPEATEG